MNLELLGKSALVTGASGDLGAACAEVLAAEGVRVRLAGRRASVLEAIASRIRERGGDAQAVAGELADEQHRATLVPDEGGPDIVVHAAGHRFAYAKLHAASQEDARTSFAIEYDAFADIARRALPQMMARRFGRLVVVTSVVASAGAGASPHYAAVKAALEGLVRVIAIDFGRYRITANAVAPGFLDTTRFAERAADHREKLAAATSTKRIATPREVATPIAFLCSPLASAITGTTLVVAGGGQLNNLW